MMNKSKFKNKEWDNWEKNLVKYDIPFDVERNQPKQQIREGLDDIFSIVEDLILVTNNTKEF